jgi:molybdenum cofactor biosynthesis enzyme MoaA
MVFSSERSLINKYFVTTLFYKKILVLGNNSLITDQEVDTLASQDQTINFGLVTDPEFMPNLPGYYHTTCADLSVGEIARMAQYYDSMVLSSQPADQWSHHTLFSATVKLLEDLQDLGHNVIMQSASTSSRVIFKKILETNKSFCIYPFMNLESRDGEHTLLCSRSLTPVTKIHNLGNWQTNADYQHIRKQMLAGNRLPNFCGYCYNIEEQGGKPARIFETLDWAQRLNLQSLEDAEKITSPIYYEIRPSNKCNLMCRPCVPRDSHLIDQEFKHIKIKLDKGSQAADHYTGFEIVNFDNLKGLYVAGGEPTVMPELYDFLRKCISQHHTDFEFMINTNAVKLSDTLLDLFSHFSNLGFSASLDGVELVNDYIRYPSKFESVIDNIKKLQANGHKVSFISVVSIYNVASLHSLLEFQDEEFPNSPVQLQFDSFYNDIQSAFNHPNRQLVLDSLERCKKTKVYFNYSRGTKSVIDQLHQHYSNSPAVNMHKLKEFFDFNRKLDQSRNQKLADYIPELAVFDC